MYNNNFKKESLTNNLEYQSYLKEEKIRLARIISILGVLLYGAFIIVDFFALPSAFSTAVIIRTVVLLILAIAYASTYSSKFIQFYSLIVSLEFIATVGGIEAMLFLATPSDHAYLTYFAGVMIVMITLYSWTYLSFYLTTFLSIAALSGYFYIEISVRNMIINENYPLLITNTFMLVSAVIFGLTAQSLRNSYLRQNFLLQQSLKESLEEKTVEASDFAHQANHDHLTGLPNRRYITELLQKSLDIAKKHDKVLIIMYIDLNGFKQINDIYGHAAGDEVLLIVAKRLELAVRKGDSLSRLGGDEYLIGLLIDKEHLSEVESMAKKFATIMSDPMNINGSRLKVGASIGISAYPIHGNNINVLIGIADKRMYQAKNFSEKSEKNIEDVEPVVIFPGNKKLK